MCCRYTTFGHTDPNDGIRTRPLPLVAARGIEPRTTRIPGTQSNRAKRRCPLGLLVDVVTVILDAPSGGLERMLKACEVVAAEQEVVLPNRVGDSHECLCSATVAPVIAPHVDPQAWESLRAADSTEFQGRESRQP